MVRFIMDLLMDIWLKIGNVVYWLFWFGSVALGITSMGWGILVGLVAWIVWAIILQVMWWKEYREWLWE
jgi:hypothetical protein